jgi:thymidine kinase
MSLSIIIGPMYSGKTWHLIKTFHKKKEEGKKVAVINYSADTRYGDNILSTHNHITIQCIMVTNLCDIWLNREHPNYSEVKQADVILINEAQFFVDLEDVVIDMLENCEKEIEICGLDGTYQRSQFGHIFKLLPLADHIEKLRGQCAKCPKESIFTLRISQDTEEIVIGGSDKYIPVCRSCYVNNYNK